MKNIRALIIDDEKHSRETLKNLIEIYCVGIEVIGSTGTVNESIKMISTLKPELIFMDIELQTGTGFDILSQLEEVDFEVIFTTAFDQYAIKAVKFSSLDYLLKPIDIEELQQAVEKAKKIKNKQDYTRQLQNLIQNLHFPKNSRICLATSDGFEYVTINEIIYCEASGSYTLFVLTGKRKLLVSKHLKEYENLLTDHRFMRVHNSYLINLREVKKYSKSDGGYITMNNNDIVSISRNKKEEFLLAMQITP
jgi:two-component system LytT family response regulator